MSNPEPGIRINVDVTNPGQFFACCGLLELADRLWPGAEGWFEGNTFMLSVDNPELILDTIIEELLAVPEFLPPMNKMEATSGSKSKLIPITLTFSKSIMVIDWWCDRTKQPSQQSNEIFSKSDFKTWSGNQSPQQIVYDKILPATRRIVETVSADKFHEQANLSGRFGFDHTAALKAIDVGWSPDKHNTSVGTSPVIELLAMVGLQRFRPRLVARKHYQYQVWSTCLPIVAAAAAAGCSLPLCEDSIFCFHIAKRGDYMYFTISTTKGAST